VNLGFLTACLPSVPLHEVAAWAAANGYETLEVAAWPATAGNRPLPLRTSGSTREIRNLAADALEPGWDPKARSVA